MRPEVVFVVDEKYSPLWRAACSHSKSRSVEILCSNEFMSIKCLIREISRINAPCVIFSWRGAFDSVMSSNRARIVLKKSGISIFLLIPDLIGATSYEQAEQLRIDLADGLLVTSRELLDRYRLLYQVRSIQILHDLVPFEILDFVIEENLPRHGKQIIWIGNSQWGQRQGFKDHKGLKTITIPVYNLLKNHESNIYLKVIDSAEHKVPYLETMRELAVSDCLVFTSKSEGTGLPIIEAAYLGTPVVTFDVGIASELLTNELSELISPHSVEVFASKVLQVLNNFDFYSEKFSKRSTEYQEEMAFEFKELNLIINERGAWRDVGSKFKLRFTLYWLARWINYQLVKLRIKLSQR